MLVAPGSTTFGTESGAAVLGGACTRTAAGASIVVAPATCGVGAAGRALVAGAGALPAAVGAPAGAPEAAAGSGGAGTGFPIKLKQRATWARYRTIS